MIKVGIIGANPDRGWAVRAHVPALHALPEHYRLTAVATANPDSAHRAAAQFGAEHAFADHRRLVEHPDVDLVIVSVKVPTHLELAGAAIAAGKHVFSEWPLTVTTAEALRLADLADAAGVRTTIGLQARFAPAVARAADLIAAGRIGRVTSITSYGARTKGGGSTIPQWLAYTYDRTTGAGALEITGGHTLDAVRFLAGPIALRPAITAIANPRHTIAETGEVVETTTPDQIVVTGDSAGGATVSMSIHDGVAGPSLARVEIAGTEGKLAVDTLPTDSPFGAQLQIGPLRLREFRDGTWQDVELPTWPGLPDEAVNVARLYRRLAEDLRTGSRVVPDFRAATEVHQLLDTLRG
ncbi:MAG TPA: Gfo/Idh/MocA family oxidoreductase [Pseudonocardiaceae bacterium]|nr:Gfo/Idh/MocA family oxidoreductase [Pseudonocardiaceae bacterium]